VRVALTIEGRSYTVEFEPGSESVQIGEHTYPVRILSMDGEHAEVEIAGEKLIVDGWPPRNPDPIGRLSVGGEVVGPFAFERREATRPAAPSTRTGSAASPTPERAAAAPESSAGPGVAVRPPMPGKVLEVRVENGSVVAAGQLLFVFEAMKMRNEVVAPVAGTIAGLAIQVGLSVRTKDVALRIVPA
jgi:glutaconyl-CoA/methylmalonyl-CoA decarboxylase subunit gamma